ncbi:hypothetical protein BD410DRAFT_14800 [Rickenella mellea]|uniref:HIG1 domain-containing protein n=1 Tax=Rickenella mellea TaxID=50990 RepID=A0A4V3AZI9_9AGAM|nr:hypothetical protein BD410DRAFT_14800 [Rickenella mellea]
MFWFPFRTTYRISHGRVSLAMSTTAQRLQRRQEADHAYELQKRAGLIGATKYTGIGAAVVTAVHFAWPGFRRQTLAFKAFLVSGFTIFGLVTWADHALLSHESDKREADSQLRISARREIARKGMIPTETAIAKWKAERNSPSQQGERPR